MTNEQLIFHIYMDQIVKNIFIFVGPGGPSIIIVGPSILLLSSPFTNIQSTCKKNPKYNFCSCLGGPGGPFAASKVPKCQRIKTSSQWRHMYHKENDQLFIYGTRCEKMNNFGYFGGPGNTWGRTSIIWLGLSLCASIISFMLIYMSTMEVIW